MKEYILCEACESVVLKSKCYAVLKYRKIVEHYCTKECFKEVEKRD